MLKKKTETISSAPTSIHSRSSSGFISAVSSPVVKSSSSVDVLQKNLYRKQLKLTKSLVDYSNTLNSRIPAIAQKWSAEDQRLKKIISIKKKVVLRFDIKEINSENFETLQKRVLAAEDKVKQERNIVDELKMRVGIMINKMNEYEKKKKKLDWVDGEIFKMRERIKTMMKYKEISKKNLSDLEASKRNLVEIEEFYIKKSEDLVERLEEVSVMASSIMEFKGKLERDRNCPVFRENSELFKDLEENKRRYEEMQGKKLEKTRELKQLRDKIEAKIALMTLEAIHVLNKRKKIRQVIYLISTKLKELQKIYSKAY